MRSVLHQLNYRVNHARRPAAVGFSLMEVIVVLMLVALAASSVVLVFRDTYFDTQMSMTLDRLEMLNEQTRMSCLRKNANRTFVVDLDRQTIFRQPEGHENERFAVLKLPHGIEFANLLTASSEATSGQISVPYRHDGTSVSWQLILTGPDDRQRSLLFCGRTGQMISGIDNPRMINEVFDALQ